MNNETVKLMVDLARSWQTLFGAALGTFLSVLGAWLLDGHREQKKDLKDEKDTLNNVEMCAVRCLNDAYRVRQGLKVFAEEMRKESDAFTVESGDMEWTPYTRHVVSFRRTMTNIWASTSIEQRRRTFSPTSRTA